MEASTAGFESTQAPAKIEDHELATTPIVMEGTQSGDVNEHSGGLEELNITYFAAGQLLKRLNKGIKRLMSLGR